MNSPNENELPDRQNPSPGVHIDLGKTTIVLLTVTTKNRISWLANETAHHALREVWSKAKA